ncbi:MAG: DsbA family protein [Acetobacteraceae bacterium]|nr:DsbA family protein [Acetobacteraceae bacterium]
MHKAAAIRTASPPRHPSLKSHSGGRQEAATVLIAISCHKRVPEPQQRAGRSDVHARSKQAALFLSLLSLTGAGLARAEQFTPAQREEIVRTVRDALKQDPSILREALLALQADEAAKREAATHAAIAAQHAALVSPQDPVAGNPDGDVTIVEFFDVRCPYCRRLEPDMAQLLTQDRGVRLVYKDLPILGPASMLGARALIAAQLQGGPAAYEKLRTALMQSGPDITKETIRAEAVRAGLDWDRLQRDMENPAVQQRIDQNLKLAHSLGIQGTPAMVIGGDLLPGAVDVAELRQLVAKARTQPHASGEVH